MDIVQEGDEDLARLELGLPRLERARSGERGRGRHEGVPSFASIFLKDCAPGRRGRARDILKAQEADK